VVSLNQGLVAAVCLHFQCFDKDGNLKWEDSAHNLVVNVGLQDMNDKYFSGSTYTAAWFLALVNDSPSPSYAAGDTDGLSCWMG
jgi:hypothetical protein